jgi:hypothetical protein
MSLVSPRAGRSYGAILWDVAAGIDEAIRFVQTFEDPGDAIRSVSKECEAGEKWAVVDLRSKAVIAEGSMRAPYGWTRPPAAANS